MSVIDSVNSYVKQNYADQSAQFNKEVTEFFGSYSAKTGNSAEALQNKALEMCRTEKVSFMEALERLSGTSLPPVMKAHVSGYTNNNSLKMSPPVADANLPPVWNGNLGAELAVLITKLAEEQRIVAKESKMAMSNMIADNKLEQADKAQAAALAKAICGIASGVLQIGGGLATMGMAAQMKSTGLDSNGNMSAHNMKLNAKIQATSQLTSGTSSIINSTGELVSSHFEHGRAALDAEATRMQGQKEAVDSLMQSMNELRQKSMETQRTLMQANLETQRRILA